MRLALRRFARICAVRHPDGIALTDAVEPATLPFEWASGVTRMGERRFLWLAITIIVLLTAVAIFTAHFAVDKWPR